MAGPYPLGHDVRAMWKAPQVPAPLRDALLIAAFGVAVALAPLVWYPIVWPDTAKESDLPIVDVWIVAFSVAPFVMVAMLRGMTAIGRGMAVLATVVAGFLVVLGQVAGMDPNDSSSTAVLALVVLPVYACVAVGVVIALDLVRRAFVGQWRLWREGRAVRS
jgi:hypothetical protein